MAGIRRRRIVAGECLPIDRAARLTENAARPTISGVGSSIPDAQLTPANLNLGIELTLDFLSAGSSHFWRVKEAAEHAGGFVEVTLELSDALGDGSVHGFLRNCTDEPDLGASTPQGLRAMAP
jgi:hypothetical protein